MAGGTAAQHRKSRLALCDDLDGWTGREAQEGGTYVSLWLTHAVVQEKPTQPCKAVALQLQINFLKRGDTLESGIRFVNKA